MYSFGVLRRPPVEQTDVRVQVAPTRFCDAGLPAVEGDPSDAEDGSDFFLGQPVCFAELRTDLRRRHDSWPREQGINRLEKFRHCSPSPHVIQNYT